ncbi:hypothetical protein U1Q18_010467, partial [Sarracenia purpurea var. burkii]
MVKVNKEQWKLNHSHHEEKGQSNRGYPSGVTRQKPSESAGYEHAESRDGATQTRRERHTPLAACPWKTAEIQGVKTGDQRVQSTGLSISLEDRREKEMSSKSPRIGEIEGTIVSKLQESTPISNFKTQVVKSGHPHGNNPEKEFTPSVWRKDDYLLCEDSAPMNPGRRRDPQQSKGPSDLQTPPKSSEKTETKSPELTREGYAISDPILLSSSDMETDGQPPLENMEAPANSGPNFSHCRRIEIQNGSFQATNMEWAKIGEPSLQFLPKGEVQIEAHKEMRDDSTEYMMEDTPDDSNTWEGQSLTKNLSKEEEGRKPNHRGIKKGMEGEINSMETEPLIWYPNLKGDEPYT